MSARPIHAKKIARLRKVMRQTPHARINLVEYLTDRALAPSKRAARTLMIEGKVKAESHVIGRVKDGERWRADPIVNADLRGKISVAA